MYSTADGPLMFLTVFSFFFRLFRVWRRFFLFLATTLCSRERSTSVRQPQHKCRNFCVTAPDMSPLSHSWTLAPFALAIDRPCRRQARFSLRGSGYALSFFCPLAMFLPEEGTRIPLCLSQCSLSTHSFLTIRYLNVRLSTRSYLHSSVAASFFFTCVKQAVKANIHAEQSLMFSAEHWWMAILRNQASCLATELPM